MSMKKPDFQDRKLPGSLDKLPRFGISRSRANSREQSDRSEVDIAFGVGSLDDLSEAINRGFARPDPPRPIRKKVLK